jgi:hypothetical protein
MCFSSPNLINFAKLGGVGEGKMANFSILENGKKRKKENIG